MCIKRKYIYALLAYMLLCSTGIMAQDDKMLRWEEVYGAGGYLIEIKDSSGNIIVQKEITDTFFDVSSLPSGKYQYRVTTLNKLKEKGRSTGWMDLSIQKAIVPEIISVSTRKLAYSYDNPEVTVYGENFGSDCVLFLTNGIEKITLDFDFISAKEVRFRWNPADKNAGIYDLIVVDKKGFEGILKSAIEVIPPDIPVIESVSRDIIVHSKTGELSVRGSNLGDGTIIVIKNDRGRILAVKNINLNAKEIVFSISPLPEDKGDYEIYAVKKDIFISEKKLPISIVDPGDEKKRELLNLHIAIGWEYDIPVGDWGEHLEKSPLGFRLYIAWPFVSSESTAGIPVIGRMGIISHIDYSLFVLTRGSSEESYAIGSASAGLYYPLPVDLFSGSLEFSVSMEAGLAYSSITMIENDKTGEFSSIDSLLSTGLSAMYKPLPRLFLITSAVYRRIFYVSHPIDEIKVSLCVGIIF